MGNFACLCAPVPAFRIFFPPPPVFVPFCPNFFIVISFPFVPLNLCVFVCCTSVLLFCFLLSVFCCFASLHLLFCFLSAIDSYYSLFFASLVSLVVECVGMRVFCFLPLFYTPRDACGPEIGEKLRILLCVLS